MSLNVTELRVPLPPPTVAADALFDRRLSSVEFVRATPVVALLFVTLSCSSKSAVCFGVRPTEAGRTV